MKMVMIIYSEAADDDVMQGLKEAGLEGYTKIPTVCGEGEETEPRLGTHCWPGHNTVLFIGVGDPAVPPISDAVRRLQKAHPRAGVRGFVMPMDEIL